MKKRPNIFATMALIIGLGLLCASSISQAVDTTPLTPLQPLDVPSGEKDKSGGESLKYPAENPKTLSVVLENGREIIIDTVSEKIIAVRGPHAGKDTGTSSTSSERGSIQHDKGAAFNVQEYQKALGEVNQDSADRLRTAIDTYEQKRNAYNILRNSMGKPER